MGLHHTVMAAACGSRMMGQGGRAWWKPQPCISVAMATVSGPVPQTSRVTSRVLFCSKFLHQAHSLTLESFVFGDMFYYRD